VCHAPDGEADTRKVELSVENLATSGLKKNKNQVTTKKNSLKSFSDRKEETYCNHINDNATMLGKKLIVTKFKSSFV